MDIGFTEEQELLRASARRFLENECPTAFVRQHMLEPAAMSEVFWQKLAEQGWFGILYPEEAGSSGLGLVDMTVLMEEMGSGGHAGTLLLDCAARRRRPSSKRVRRTSGRNGCRVLWPARPR